MLCLSRIGSGALVRCCAAAAALYLLTVPGLARADEEALKFAPDNPDVLAVVELSEIFNSPAFKKISTEFPDLAKKLDEPLDEKTKLTARNVKSIFVAADSASQDFVVVVTLSAELELENLINAEQRARSEKIGDYTMYLVEDDKALCAVDGYTIAIGPTKTLRAVLNRDDDAEISDELDAAWEDIEDDQHIYVVATLNSLSQQAAGAIPQGIPLTPDTLGKVKTATIAAKADKKQITFSASLNCTDNTTAVQLKALLDLVLQGSLQPGANTPDEVKQALNAVKSSVEDESLTISVNVGLDLIISQIKSQGVAALSAGK